MILWFYIWLSSWYFGATNIYAIYIICLNVEVRKEEIKGHLRFCSMPCLPHCSEAVEPLAERGESLLCVAGCFQGQRGAGSQSPKSTPAALLDKESLWPVPGTSQHPCKTQPCSPTQLLLCKHGVFHGLLWTGLCRPAKPLVMCMALALAVPLQPW